MIGTVRNYCPIAIHEKNKSIENSNKTNHGYK